MKTTAPNCLVSQLYIETEGSLRGVAEETVRHETIGKWDRPGKPTELFRKSGGYLLDYEEHSPGKGKVALAYPLHNLDLKNSAFSHIWVSMITGMSAMPNLKRYRVLDFTLPDEAYSFFPGPRFGLEGTRQILQIDQSEPIIGTIIKPTCGLTPDEVADICEAGAMAGLKFIKDDERMMNPAYCPLREKVRKVTERLRKVYEKTGNKVHSLHHHRAGQDSRPRPHGRGGWRQWGDVRLHWLRLREPAPGRGERRKRSHLCSLLRQGTLGPGTGPGH